MGRDSKCGLIVGAALLLMATASIAQDYVNPQAIENELIRRQMEQDTLRRYNERLRMEIERRDLQDQIRYRTLSDGEVMRELMDGCRGLTSCNPPAALVHEAARRGLITPTPQPPEPGQPRSDCMVLGLGDGDSVLDCQ